MLGALGGIAASVTDGIELIVPQAVREWTTSAPSPPPFLVESVRDWLGRGKDPLGDLYNACVSSVNRRQLGTVFTPDPLVDHMLSVSERQLGRAPVCVVDPGAGVGAFTLAAARRWPDATVIAVDINVVTLGLLATRLCFEIDADPESASALGRVNLRLADYLDELGDVFAPNAPGPVLVAGNPPYTRVQSLPSAQRQKASQASAGIIDSGHANLAVLFQAATLSQMRSDDASCMVLPGSFVYTHASRGLRRSLWTSTRPVTVHRWPATARAFTGRSVQAAILAIGPEHRRRPPLRLARTELASSSVRVIEEWQVVRRATEPPENWFGSTPPATPKSTVPLTQIARVRRGSATGANEMFFLTNDIASTMPKQVIMPAVLTLRHFEGHVLDRTAHRELRDRAEKEIGRWLLVIPRDWTLTGTLKSYVESFEEKVAGRFLPSARTIWYSLTDLPRPQLLLSPLSKDAFKVVLNAVGAVPSNNIYGIDRIDGGDVSLLADWLRSTTGQRELRRVSHRYPGGSLKLEPGDLGAIRVPTALLPAELLDCNESASASFARTQTIRSSDGTGDCRQ
jgi:adenine-specific DNA-methyltransferase